ncbi:MAG TPA: VCBS repeat-containing protein, partial [Nitrospirota bacterium]
APGRMAFTDVADEAGLGGEGRSWSAVFSDFDGDSAPDLFVCQGGPGTADTSRLFINRGGKFEDATVKAGLSGISSMGAVSADFDSDGDQDLFVASFDGPDRLFMNDGKVSFTDRTAASGIGSSRSVGAAAGFVDGDFLPDLVVAGFAGPARLYRNLGGGKFEDVTTGSGLGKKKKNEGAALGDLDGDGDLDLYVANYDGANALYRNNLDSPRFLNVLPAGKGRGLAGAKAMLYRPGKAGMQDGLLAAEEYQPGSGFCSQPPAGMLFRLPDDGPYDLVVRFPGGRQVIRAGVMRGVVNIGLPDEIAPYSGPKEDSGKTSAGEVMK